MQEMQCRRNSHTNATSGSYNRARGMRAISKIQEYVMIYMCESTYNFGTLRCSILASIKVIRIDNVVNGELHRAFERKITAGHKAFEGARNRDQSRRSRKDVFRGLYRRSIFFDRVL